MIRQKVIFLLIISEVLTKTNDALSCGRERVLKNPRGTIKFKTLSEENISCNWTIVPPSDTITSLKIITFDFGACHGTYSCCLLVSSYRRKYLTLCKKKQEKIISLSLREEEIVVTSNTCGTTTKLLLEFTTRRNVECPKSDFQCLDKSNCYNSSDICHKFICNDHSDNVACGKCSETSARCNDNSDHCFELSKRCDNILDCPKGEDEVNCSKLCPQIKCPLEQKCISKDQICDKTIDCIDGFDEENCSVESTAPKIIIISSMLIICSICCTITMCLIFRWVLTRRDINRFLENPPDFPLAPFQGPGDDDPETSSSDALDAEFRAGGEIYEHYMQALKKKSRSSKAVQVGGITAKYSHMELDGENELIVLASLNIPTEMCVGLTVSSDSVATLKSIREKQGTLSSSCGGSSRLGDTTVSSSLHSGDSISRALQRGNLSSKSSGDSSLVSRRPQISSRASLSKVSDLGDSSKSKFIFGGGDCLRQTSKQLEPRRSRRQFEISEGQTNNNKPSSAPLLCDGGNVNPRKSKSNSNMVVSNSKSKNEKLQLNNVEAQPRSDSSQWTDLEDSGASKIILVKTVEEKTKPSKRSNRKKISYSCK
ncbi:hypothetical protein JTB14_023512 [Gonioctena quinquepunctata]|nr:hypothetical protein JTB14_023512 [Gonioctena quinquepunctata]